MRVFVGYGGPRAEAIAMKLVAYLRQQGISVFLAVPDSPSMIPGLGFPQRIFRALGDADVVVMVCTRATSNSDPAIQEIRLSREIDTTVIPFVESGSPTPRPLARAKIWRIKFRRDYPHTKFRAVKSALDNLEPIIRGKRRIRAEAFQP